MKQLRMALALAGMAAITGALGVSAQGADRSPLHYFFSADLTPVGGFPAVQGSSSTLVRRADGVMMELSTRNLAAGAYTVWWVIFNNPESCTAPIAALGTNCGEADLSVPAVNASVFFAAGGVVGANGNGHFSAQLGEHTLPNGLGQVVIPGTPGGLDDAEKAEIHLVVHYHGPASSNAALLAEQISTFGAGCTLATGFGLGTPGDFSCYDPQAVPHLAP